MVGGTGRLDGRVDTLRFGAFRRRNEVGVGEEASVAERLALDTKDSWSTAGCSVGGVIECEVNGYLLG